MAGACPSLGSPGAALVFGMATVLLPWLWLYPSIGLGFMASRSPRQKDCLIMSSVNHFNFGLGFAIWVGVLGPWLPA